jgi:membrane fusion protein, adhesin transport system
VGLIFEKIMLNISNQKVKQDEALKYLDLNALETLHTPRTGVVLSRWLRGIMLVFLGVLFLPWQQNINGKGSVTALTPQDRPQTIQNIIAGRIEIWKVREGQKVKQGDTLLVVSETKDDYFDPNLPQRLNEQLVAKQDGIGGYQSKISALDNQVVALQENQQLSLQKARNKIRQSLAKITADSTDVIAEEVQLRISQDRFDRGKLQYDNGGIISLNEFESRKLKLQEVQAKVVSLRNKLLISRQDLTNARIELNSITAEYSEKIAKARSDRSSALASLADGQSELSKLRNKITNVDIRRGQYVLRAPQDGYLVRTLKAGIGETLKEGEAVAVLQPSKPQKAIELYVSAMDVPLIEKGREVRLQFEGWPALQFSGWPNVSVGTFGGTVTVIDMVDSKDGNYRLLVTPKKDDEIWPEQLRLGSGVFGWIMLDDVPVWYEIWRQLNAFPPSLKKATEVEEKDKEKK